MNQILEIWRELVGSGRLYWIVVCMVSIDFLVAAPLFYYCRNKLGIVKEGTDGTHFYLAADLHLVRPYPLRILAYCMRVMAYISLLFIGTVLLLGLVVVVIRFAFPEARQDF